MCIPSDKEKLAAKRGGADDLAKRRVISWLYWKLRKTEKSGRDLGNLEAANISMGTLHNKEEEE